MKKKFRFEKGLKKLDGKVREYNIFGFDIETANNNKDFLLGSIVGKDYEKVFYDAESMRNEIATNRIFKGSYICASQLTFDYCMLFPDLEENFKHSEIIERSSAIIYVKTHVSYDEDDNKFYGKHQIKGNSENYYPILFIDSLNHLRATVQSLGNIIQMPKLKRPDHLGCTPKSKKEWNKLIKYNIRDSQITYNFMKWLQKQYNNLGCNMKVTISATALDLFRRKYLHGFWKQEEKNFIQFQYKGYHGGRCEAFKRGVFSSKNYGKINVYDIVSLYPFCLRNFKYPVPDGYEAKKVNVEKILSFEGVADIELKAPKEMLIPYLPFKSEKLLFPVGKIKGTYDFFSIREALKLGYEIKKLGKGLIYENTFKPFKTYIDSLFNLRKEFKKNNSDIQLVPKILMNSFYGKMGFNYSNKEKLISSEELVTRKDFETVTIIPHAEGSNLYRVITTDESYIPNYVFPLLPLYVTSYARNVLYNYFKNIGFERILYTDTDSIFTTRTINTGSDIGNLQLEKRFDEVCIVKPKFYGGIIEENEQIRIKGLHGKLKNYAQMKKLVKENNFKVNCEHFAKLRTALQKRRYINEVYNMSKEMQLEDDKRIWEKNKFTLEPQSSKPILF